MAIDPRKHRRQAAWICFKPHLNQDQLIKAIQILEHNHQHAGISSLIAYINKICTEFNIDTQTRKSLYVQLHQLIESEIELSTEPDPLLIKKQSPGQAPQAVAPAQLKPTPEASSENSGEPTHKTPPATQTPSSSPALNTEETTRLQTEPKETPLTAPKKSLSTASGFSQPRKKPVLPAHTVVFSHLMRHVIDSLPGHDYVDFFDILIELSRNKKTGSKVIEVHANTWAVSPFNFDWATDITEQRLTDFVRLVYTALSEFVGPVKADAAFHNALGICAKLPEARHFPPARFL